MLRPVILREDYLGRFKLLMERSTFVDKTELIKDFLKLGCPHAVLAPFGFGKSQTLRTLELFYRIPVDKNSTEVKNDVIEAKREVFEELKICRKDKTFCDEHMSKYPIIRIELNFGIERGIIDAFHDNDFLKSSSHLNDTDKKLVEKYTQAGSTIYNTSLPVEDVELGGLRLSELLFKHFKQKCIVLIDDYDQVAFDGFWDRGSDSWTEKTFGIMAKFLTNLLKDNKYVGHAFLTGTTRVGDVYTSDLDKLTRVSVFDSPKFSKFFGFTDDDIQYLLDQSGRSAELESAKILFHGYGVIGSKQKLFNTMSVDSYLETNHLDDVWHWQQELVDIRAIHDFHLFGELYERSTEEGVTITRKERLDKDDFRFLQRLVRPGIPTGFTGNENIDLLFQFLQEQGYYRIDKKLAGGKVALFVVNTAVKKCMQDELYTMHYFKDKYGIVEADVNELSNCFLAIGEGEKSFHDLARYVARIAESPNLKKEYELRNLLPRLSDEACHWASFLRGFGNEHVKLADGTLKYIDFVVYRRDGTRLLFEVRFEESSKGSSYEALKEILRGEYYSCQNFPKDFVLCNDVLIGLFVSKKKQCYFSYLYNSKSITDAVNVTLPENM